MAGTGTIMERPYKPRQHPRATVPYTYTRLSEAIQSVGTEKPVVNVYGVITDFESPRTTSGTDCIATMTVIDMSYSSPGMRLLFFAKDMDLLPRVNALGDIIRIHRLEVKQWNNGVQGHAKVGKNAHFLLFNGQPNSASEPYACSSQNFTWEDQDRAFLRTMRSWGATQGVEALNQAKEQQYVRTISAIEPEGGSPHLDLYCKVLWVDERGGEDRSPLILHVWDGTDARPAVIPNSPDDELDPLELLRHQPPPSVLANWPPLGTALPIVPDNLPLDNLPLTPVAGKWYKFRNLRVVRERGSLLGLWGKSTKVMALTGDERHVQDRLRYYEERANASERITDESAVDQEMYSVADHGHVPLSTLREALATPSNIRNSRFRCIVRVRSCWPPCMEDLCVNLTSLDEPVRSAVEADLRRDAPGESPEHSPRNPEGVPQKKRRKEEWVFRATLMLEDPTGQLCAELFGKDAEAFFGGWSARDLHTKDDGAEELRRKLDEIMGRVGENEEEDSEEQPPAEVHERDPPWLVCCIQSYFPEGIDTRCFRIFDTKLAL